MLFSDFYCPPVPQVEFATPDSKKSLVGEVVNYRCIQNYRFPDGSSYKTTTCLESKKWSPVLPDCICKYDNKKDYQNYFTTTKNKSFLYITLLAICNHMKNINTSMPSKFLSIYHNTNQRVSNTYVDTLRLWYSVLRTILHLKNAASFVYIYGDYYII